MKSLVIIGTGDYAEMACRYIQRDTDMEVQCFSVEQNYIKEQKFCNREVRAFEDLEQYHAPEDTQVLVAIGPNRVNSVRQRLFEEAEAKGYSFLTYISNRAHVWDEEAVGRGSFIFDGCVIEPGATIGANTVLWSNATVAHHTSIGAHCFLAPGASVSGRIKVLHNCFLGINCTIRDNVTIAERCIIGGGAVIKKDTVAGGVYSALGTELRNIDSLNTRV